MNEINDELLKRQLIQSEGEAKELIKDEDKFERFIQRLEQKVKLMPKIGEYASDLACVVSMVRSYIKKEYTEVPIGTILSIVGVLIYIVSPVDLIPDTIPVAGQMDDLAFFIFVLKFISSDVNEYRQWRIDNGKQIVDIF